MFKFLSGLITQNRNNKGLNKNSYGVIPSLNNGYLGIGCSSSLKIVNINTQQAWAYYNSVAPIATAVDMIVDGQKNLNLSMVKVN